MALADRVDEIVRGLPRGWERARLELTVEEPEDADRASLVLAPATPGRSGSAFTLYVHDGASGLSPTAGLVKRVVARLDEAGIRGRVRLAGHEQGVAKEGACRPGARGSDGAGGRLGRAPAPAPVRLVGPLRRGGARLDGLPRARGAAARAGQPCALRRPVELSLRAASSKGYGVAPGMARRALERLDDEGLSGRVRVLRVLSDTNAVSTQGPVWRVDGRSV